MTERRRPSDRAIAVRFIRLPEFRSVSGCRRRLAAAVQKTAHGDPPGRIVRPVAP
ncbi:MAG: hypothetical protein ACE5KM_17675 [Planctomycetaceae bacterium]